MMYIVVRCPRCGELMLANTANQTRTCPNCNNRTELRSLRVYGRVNTPSEATELMKRLKAKEGGGEDYTPSFKRLNA
jgi:DNA-directed RNA polymerase subunit M/transcription elongation factor TFIIS